MSVGARLKEERQRLGLSQPAFAALAGAKQGAQLKWEKDQSSPNAAAMAAWHEAGVDVIYVLSGVRQEDRRADTIRDIEDQLAEISRAILSEIEEPTREKRLGYKRQIEIIRQVDAGLITYELDEEARRLLAIIEDEHSLRRARIEKLSAERAKRDQAKRRLSEWFEGQSYKPNEGVMQLLLTLNLEYGAPPKLLSYLVEEVQVDVLAQP